MSQENATGATSMTKLELCTLDINTTLPLVCICSLFSFLCGVGIGANDLSANFAMVVGSGSLNMRKAITYCTALEILGAAFMGGHVSSTIRNGIVDAALFNSNRDMVVLGMTASTFAAAIWLYLSAVFGLPVSITHTVVGSLLGFAVFSTWSFDYVMMRGLAIIALSWVTAPLISCIVTASLFYILRRDVFKVKGRSFELAMSVLPVCLAVTLLVDFFFVLIERPPIMSATLAQWVPLVTQFMVLLLLVVGIVYASRLWYFPLVAADAKAASEFVWESRAVRTEAVKLPEAVTHAEEEQLELKLSFFTARRPDALPPLPVGSQGSRPPTPRQGPTMVLSSLVPSDRCVLQESVRVAVASGSRRSRLPRGNAEPAVDPSSGVFPHLESASLLPQPSLPDYGAQQTVGSMAGPMHSDIYIDSELPSPKVVRETDAFGEEDWGMDHLMEPINFGGLLIKPFNPRAEYLFTSLQVVAGSMSSFVHGAVAGANATATFVILYEAFTNHELKASGLGTQWSVFPAMLGIAIGMFSLGARLMRTIGMELVTVTPARGWCIQVGGTAVTMVLTGLGIPVSLSQSQVGAAIGCGVVDAQMAGVSWRVVLKIVAGWVVTLVISATTTGAVMWAMAFVMC